MPLITLFKNNILKSYKSNAYTTFRNTNTNTNSLKETYENSFKMENTQVTGLNQICAVMHIWNFGEQADELTCEKYDRVDTKPKTSDNGVTRNSLHPFFCLSLNSESTDNNMEHQPMHMIARKGNNFFSIF